MAVNRICTNQANHFGFHAIETEQSHRKVLGEHGACGPHGAGRVPLRARFSIEPVVYHDDGICSELKPAIESFDFNAHPHARISLANRRCRLSTGNESHPVSVPVIAGWLFFVFPMSQMLFPNVPWPSAWSM